MTSVFALGLAQALAAVVLLAGLVQGDRDLVVFPVLVLAVVNAARLMSRFSARRLSVQVSLSSSRLYPGEETALTIAAANLKLLPVCLRAEVSLPVRQGAGETPEPVGAATPGPAAFVVVPPRGGPAEPDEEGLLISKETGLLWHQRVLWKERLVALRRGIYHLGPVQVRAGDILGFFNGRREPGMAVDLVVYPRLVDLALPPAPVRDFFGLKTARTPVEDPVNQVGTRDYDGSRPARHIHWKASARFGLLQEKLYEPTSQASVLLLIDAASFADPAVAPGQEGLQASEAARREELFERTLEAAASLSVRLEEARVPVGIAVNGALAGGGPPVMPAGRGPYQVGRLLEILARLTRLPAARAGSAPDLEMPITGGTTCVVFYRERTAFEALRGRLRVAVVLVPAGDPPEGGFPTDVPVLRLEELHTGRGLSHG